MSVVSILDGPVATLWYHPEAGIVHHQFKKYAYGDDLKAVLDRGYEVLKANKGTKWLSDDRANNALRPEDAQWAQTDWFPRVVAAGWKYWAIVLPETVVGKMNMRGFIEQYAQAGITAQVFTDPAQALSWLESV